MLATRRTCFVILAAALLAPALASAENAWVRGGIRLNLRTEPGTQYRIIGVITTGDGLQVLRRTESWTQIRLENGDRGWIPKGYLQAEPPPTVRLQQLEDDVTNLRAKLDESDATTTELRLQNEEIASRDGGQREEIERLSQDNTELRAGKRWPEWITGASVLAAGIMLGALWHRSATRRPASRIKL